MKRKSWVRIGHAPCITQYVTIPADIVRSEGYPFPQLSYVDVEFDKEKQQIIIKKAE